MHLSWKNIHSVCLFLFVNVASLYGADPIRELDFSAHKCLKATLTNYTDQPVSFFLYSQYLKELPPQSPLENLPSDEGFCFELSLSNQPPQYLKVLRGVRNTQTTSQTLKLLQRRAISLEPQESLEVLVSGVSYITKLTAREGEALPQLGWGIKGINFYSGQSDEREILCEIGDDRQKNVNSMLTEVRPTWSSVFDMARVMYQKSRDDILVSAKEATITSQAICSLRCPVRVIEHISHRVWVTSSATPYEAPKDRLNYYINNCRMFNDTHGDWKHYFWCLDPSKIPETVAYLLAAGVGIEIKTIDELFPRMRAKHIFNAYLRDSIYVYAGEIVRANVVYFYGGLYCDLGIDLDPEVGKLIDCCEYMGWLWGSNFDSTVIGAQSGDLILGEYLTQIENLYRFSQNREVRKLVPREWQINWTGGCFLGSILLCKSSRKTLFISDVFLAESHRLDSWGRAGSGTGSFGNRSVKAQSFDLFDICPEKVEI